MAVLDGTVIKFAEFVDEATMGTTPTNPTMKSFFGQFISGTISSAPNIDKFNVMKSASSTDPLSSGKAWKVGESHKITIKVKPTSIGWMPYALHAASTTTYAAGKVPHYISIGMVIGDKFCVAKGCVMESASCDFNDMKKSAELTLEFICADVTDWSSIDYIGLGAHAAEVTTTPYNLVEDVTYVLYDGVALSSSDLIFESLKFGAGAKVEAVQDLSSSLESKIAAYALSERSLPLEVKITAMSATVQNDLRDADTHTFAFTLGGKKITISSVVWSNSPAFELDPVKRVGMSLSADAQSARIAIA